MKKAYLLTKLGRCWALALTLGLISSFQLNATTCANAVVIGSLPFTGPTTCAATNDITSTNAPVCSPVTSSYYGGMEALFRYTPATNMFVNIAYSGQTWTSIVVFNGCPTSGGTCVAGVSSSASSKNVNANLVAGNTYYIMIDVFPSPPSPCPGTVTITEMAPPTCSGATAISSLPFSGALTCGGNVITSSNASCTGVSTSYFGGNEALFTFTPASSTVINITYSGQTFTQISVYQGCPLSAGGCVAGIATSAASKNLVVPVTGGIEYYILIDTWPSPPSPCPGTIDVAVWVPPVGDNCSNAQDLATLTSPYAATTVGYTNDISGVGCLNASPDRIFYIDVPPAGTLVISTPTDNYDSRHRVAYGGACPGATQIDCIDDPDNAVTTWVNATGSMQRVYWVQEAFSTTVSGTFTLQWTLTVPPPVPNDLCTAAEPIACGETVSGTTIGAAIDAVGTCGTTTTAPGAWYTFTASNDARFYTLSTCGQADFDTKISVFTGSCDRLVCIGGADDSDGCSGGTTELLFTPVYGAVHYVLVHGFGTTIGDFELTLDCGVEAIPTGCTDPNALNYDPEALIDDGSCIYPPPAPPGDACSSAFPIGCGDAVTGTTIGFTDNNPSACGGAGDGASPGVWYTIVGTGDVITAETCGSGFDTQVAVYTGSCAGLACVAGNDDACGLQSRVAWPSTVGTVYYLYLDGFGSGAGSYILSITCAAPAGNDNCSGAIPLSCGQTIAGATTGNSDSNPPACGGAGDGASPGVWYSVVGTGASITASTCGSGFDTQVAIYSGTCTALTCVAGNDDACGLQSTVTWNSTLGTTYYIYVDGFGSASGSFTLSVTCAIPPPQPDNDTCADAFELACNTTVSGSTAGAAADVAPTCDGVTVTSRGVWYTFTGSSRIVNLNTCGSGYDTKLSVYAGSCTGLECVAANDDFCGLQSSVSFVPQQGVQYYVLVHGFGTATGSFTLEYDCESPLPRTPGITPVSNASGISLFPNPAQDELNVKMEGFLGGRAILRVHNSLGQLMLERRVDIVEEPIQRLNTSQLQSGMYFLTVDVDGKGKFTEKFMVGAVRP